MPNAINAQPTLMAIRNPPCAAHWPGGNRSRLFAVGRADFGRSITPMGVAQVANPDVFSLKTASGS